MSIRHLLEYVEDQKRRGEAYGWKLEVVVMSLSDHEEFLSAVATVKSANEAYDVVRGEKGTYEKLYGARLIWSGDRLPPHQVWLRFAGSGKKGTK